MAVLENQQEDQQAAFRWWCLLRKGSHATTDGSYTRMVAPKEIEWLRESCGSQNARS